MLYNQNYNQLQTQPHLSHHNARDAALLRRPNFAHLTEMGSIMSTESDRDTITSDQYSMSDQMIYTPAMPILPDMPTRSRKLLEDLGSSPIGPSGVGIGGKTDNNN